MLSLAKVSFCFHDDKFTNRHTSTSFLEGQQKGNLLLSPSSLCCLQLAASLGARILFQLAKIKSGEDHIALLLFHRELVFSRKVAHCVHLKHQEGRSGHPPSLSCLFSLFHNGGCTCTEVEFEVGIGQGHSCIDYIVENCFRVYSFTERKIGWRDRKLCWTLARVSDKQMFSIYFCFLSCHSILIYTVAAILAEAITENNTF